MMPPAPAEGGRYQLNIEISRLIPNPLDPDEPYIKLVMGRPAIEYLSIAPPTLVLAIAACALALVAIAYGALLWCTESISQRAFGTIVGASVGTIITTVSLMGINHICFIKRVEGYLKHQDPSQWASSNQYHNNKNFVWEAEGRKYRGCFSYWGNLRYKIEFTSETAT